MLSLSHPSHLDPDASPLLVGRDREQRVLRDALRATLAGHGQMVLIAGEAGIGKTALAESLGHEAAAEGALVLVGRCFDLTETPPYGPWRDVLDGVTPDGTWPDVPVIFQADRAVEDVSSRQALYAEAHAFLLAVSARQPVIILLDDLHWSDLASLDLLRVLARDVHGLRLMIIGIYRDDEIPRRHPVTTLLTTLVRETRAMRMMLRPLDISAVWSLVEHRYHLPDDDRSRLVDYLQRHAEGNPFFLTEILRTLEDEEVLRVREGAWLLGGLLHLRMPTLVRQVIEGRLVRLRQQTEALLQVAAVIGQDVRLDIWRTVSEASDDLLSIAIQEAVDTHILVESPDGAAMRFTHALIREALYEALDLIRRIDWHRRAAEFLMVLPKPDPDSVAYHLRQARDPRAAEWQVQAGDRARRAYAWETARDRYESALRLLADLPATRDRGWLLYRLATLFLHSDPQRSMAILADVRQCATMSDDDALLAQTAFFFGSYVCQMGDYRRGLREMQAGFAALQTLPEHERARREALLKASAVEFDPVGESGLVMWLAATGHFAEARAIGERSDTLRPAALEGDDAGALMAYGYLGLALVHANTGRPDQARSAYAEARARYQARDNRMGLYMALTHELVNLTLPYEADQVERRQRLRTALEEAWARATTGNIDQSAQQGLLPLLALEGDWLDARKLALAGLARGMGGASRAFPARALIAIAYGQGDVALAWQLVFEDLPDGAATNPGGTIYTGSLVLLRTAAALALDDGDVDAARRWLEAHDRWLSWADAHLGRAEGHLLWARYHDATGDSALAFKHAEQAIERASHPRQPLALLATHRLLGEFETASGRHASARAHLDTSLALADACAAPYERALSLLALAELHASIGDRSGALELAEHVRAICTPLGAKPALARANALTSIPTAARDGYPDRLTPREAEVLRRIAAGLSNQAIAADLSISVRTVNRHITNLYTKIGAHGKADATAYAFRHHLT